MNLRILRRAGASIRNNPLIMIFGLCHLLFAVFLGRLFALAPDEEGYLYTFNHLYWSSSDPNPQYASGWITAPKVFLWISYLPAKILTILGMPDYLAIRILSIILTLLSIIMLLNFQKRTRINKKAYQSVVFIIFLFPSVFLWTSIGLRESFIFIEMVAFFVGMSLIIQGQYLKSFFFLFLSSYGLISTKTYLWACLL